VTLPFPLLMTVPPVDLRETCHLPTIPFRFRFHSSLANEFPLLTFASPETSDWKLQLMRRVTVWIHNKSTIRTLPLRNSWRVDAREEEQQSTPYFQSHGTEESQTEHPIQPLPTIEQAPQGDHDEDPATPPPEFAEIILDRFPPVHVTSDDENIYVRGKLALSRVAFKSILAPIHTPDILVEYYLDVEIKPKSGSVKESFGPLKGHFPVMFETM
jgi:hypothetical protein